MVAGVDRGSKMLPGKLYGGRGGQEVRDVTREIIWKGWTGGPRCYQGNYMERVGMGSEMLPGKFYGRLGQQDRGVQDVTREIICKE